MRASKKIAYARMWPREVFYCLVQNENGSKRKKQPIAKGLEFVEDPGVYVLYRDDIPYYVGQAKKLRHRLWAHACTPGARYHNFWNFFSAFVIRDPDLRNQVEGILIAAMPTANGAKPRLKRIGYSPAVRQMARDINQFHASPMQQFKELANTLRRAGSLRRIKRKRL
jgi:hypothetical protein